MFRVNCKRLNKNETQKINKIISANVAKETDDTLLINNLILFYLKSKWSV
jgi:hypothetical protein